MAKGGKAKRKQAKEADRWVSANAPKPRTSDVPGYPCPRCGTDLGHPANQGDHNQLAHQGN